MKLFLLLALAILSFNPGFSAPVNKAKSNGLWTLTTNWTLNRLPQVGDTIEIPAGITIIINNDQIFNGFVFIRIKGTLQFQNNNSTLQVGTTSCIVLQNGRISGGGSPSQRIRMGNTSIFNGGQNDITGFQIANGSSNGFNPSGESALPVRFINFDVIKNAEGILVQWSTAQEQDAFQFEVQRSLDGNVWSTIAKVTATGNSNNRQNYSYTDKLAAAGQLYYRLKQVDASGTYLYTAVRKTNNTRNTVGATIKISSAANNVVLHFAETAKNVAIHIINLNGQVIATTKIGSALGSVVISSSTKGAHVVSVTNNNNMLAAAQVML